MTTAQANKCERFDRIARRAALFDFGCDQRLCPWLGGEWQKTVHANKISVHHAIFVQYWAALEVNMVHRARWTCLCLLIVAFSATADWRSQLPGAQRLGAGEFTWFGLRLYTAQLWTLAPALDWNQPFALELLYHRSLSKDTLVQASLEEMHRLNAGGIAPQQRPAWTQALEAAFVDVRPGMRITGLYLPGQGCRFYVDGELSREITDPVFARAFFAIWLDPRARDPQLRQRLLGLAGSERGR